MCIDNLVLIDEILLCLGGTFMEENNLLLEYNQLRDEIKRKIDLQNNLITFGITTVTAILVAAVQFGNHFLYLLPYCVIIPMLFRTTYYYMALIKMSTYIETFIEQEVPELNWETRRRYQSNTEYKSHNIVHKVCDIISSYERILDLGSLGMICTGLFSWKIVTSVGTYSANEKNVWTGVAVFLLVWSILIIARFGIKTSSKKKWIEEWERVKEVEKIKQEKR